MTPWGRGVIFKMHAFYPSFRLAFASNRFVSRFYFDRPLLAGQSRRLALYSPRANELAAREQAADLQHGELQLDISMLALPEHLVVRPALARAQVILKNGAGWRGHREQQSGARRIKI